MKVFSALLLVMFSLTVFTACSNDDDPADNDFFAGTYKGKISYNDGSKTTNVDNGSVFVTKIGSKTTYNFTFSDGIASINGVEFEKSGDNSMANVGATNLKYIRINANTLKILYTVDGKTWTADATR